MKNIIILGASGSIGSQSIFLLKNRKDEYNLIGVSVGNNINFLIDEIIPYFNLKYICVKNENDYKRLKEIYKDIKLFYGDEGLISLTKIKENDVILNSLVGFSGVLPSISTIKNNKYLFLANKESLVVAGEIIYSLKNARNLIYPIDSEHAAITKCLKNVKDDELETIYLTCSGGPFFSLNNEEFKNIKLSDALNHPTYKMGKKITIDSSTLMNKAFEIIEAHYLFNVDIDKIKVKIDRNSYVHSFILLKDGTYKLSVGKPDMKIQINDCLSMFKTSDKEFKDTEINTYSNYKFYEVDHNKFPLIDYGYLVIQTKGISGLVLNSANEVAVNEFLKGNINYIDIKVIIDKILKMYQLYTKLNEEDLLSLHKKVTIDTLSLINKKEY